jgi:hypothetical protein
MALSKKLRRIAAAALAGASLAADTASASGGSPLNGSYAGTSVDGRHHIEVNVNGGRVLTTNLRLRCPDGRRGYADFEYGAPFDRGGRFTASSRGRGRSRGAELVIEGQAVRNGLKGRLSVTGTPCDVGPVRFTVRR